VNGAAEPNDEQLPPYRWRRLVLPVLVVAAFILASPTF
jgi:hypothetical protein